MSRVGKKPIPVPSGVKIQVGDQLTVQGPKGTLHVPVPKGIRVQQNDGKLHADVMPDYLHPNEHGYQLWADAMEPTLAKMLQ